MPGPNTPDRSPLGLMKNFFTLIGLLLIIVFLLLCTRETWKGYQAEKTAERFEKEGVPVRVKLNKVSTGKKIWQDYIGNSRYVGFAYQGKDYTIRYVQDTIFLQEGTIVPVLYHPPSDAFLQPGRTLKEKTLYKTSPLVDWTIVRFFSGSHKWLFFFILLATVSCLLILGFFAKITGLGFFHSVQQVIIRYGAIAAAIFVTYDAAKYTQYFYHLQGRGQIVTVRIEDLSKIRQGRGNNYDDGILFYDYNAKVGFRNELRIIVISEGDYDGLKSGDSLKVLYDPSIDDMMSVHASLRYSSLVFPLVIWMIVLFHYSRSVRRRRSL